MPWLGWSRLTGAVACWHTPAERTFPQVVVVSQATHSARRDGTAIAALVPGGSCLVPVSGGIGVRFRSWSVVVACLLCSVWSARDPVAADGHRRVLGTRETRALLKSLYQQRGDGASLDYRWNLRQVMATRGMFATTDLLEPLAERGIAMSSSQVYRLVVERPERVRLQVLVALLDILDCTMDQLIEPLGLDGTHPPTGLDGTRPPTGLNGTEPSSGPSPDGEGPAWPGHRP
jgi:DNA-binding Xre family transcriptional regulator